MRGINGLQDCFSLRSEGACNEDYILMQYTGVKDKNGKEIYEGDIVIVKGTKRIKYYITEAVCSFDEIAPSGFEKLFWRYDSCLPSNEKEFLEQQPVSKR